MTDPTDYHRKLAEICAAGKLGLTREECSFNEQDIDLAAAALASEGVVDPEAKNALLIEQTLGYIAEIERLQKFIAQRSIKSRAIGISLGMEQAAKKCDEIDEPDVAAAIRAEKANVE